MGSKFVEGRSVEFSKSYEESSPSTPIFFILSPGVDPLKDVEALGKCSWPAQPVTGKRKSKPQGMTADAHWVAIVRNMGNSQRWWRGKLSPGALLAGMCSGVAAVGDGVAAPP